MKSKMLLRWIVGVVVCLPLNYTRVSADDSSPEIIQYKTPAGWNESEQGGASGRIYTSPDSTVSTASAMDLYWEGDGGSVDLRNTPIIFLRE